MINKTIIDVEFGFPMDLTGSNSEDITCRSWRPILPLDLFIFLLFIYLLAFLDTGLSRGNVHELNSGPMQGAIPTQSHKPYRLAKPPGSTTPTLFE